MGGDTDASRYHDIFEMAPDPIMVHDPETGVIVDANPAACELVDLEYSALVGEHVGSFSPWEFTTADANTAIEEAVTEGTSRVDWAVCGPDGERRRLDVTLKRATVGGEIRVVAFISDVSKRRDHERAHAEWNEQVRTLVDNLPVVVFTLAPDGTFTHAAGKGLDSLGLESSDLVGHSIFDVYRGSPKIIEAAARALEGNEIRETQPVDEFLFETWYRPVFEDGELGQVVGVARDITELKRREEHVRALSVATNDLLYTHTEASVGERVVDIAERIIDRPIAVMYSYDSVDDVLIPIGATPMATDFAGVELPKELPTIGPGHEEKAIFDAGKPVVIDEYSGLDNPSTSGVPFGTVLCVPLDDSGLLCVGSTVVEPFDESERHLLDILSSTATAALDRVARETKLEAQRAALERSNEALERQRDQMEFFNSTLRHDILNGMNVIRARAARLADDLDGEQAHYAETIVDWSDDITALTRKVRSVLRTLADDGAAETKPVELAPVVEAAADRAATLDADALIEVSTPDDVFVTADDLLDDVFGNILTNAVEHGSTNGRTGSGGAVEHGSTSPDSKARRDGDENRTETVSVTVTTTVDDERVTVVVADDGPGVAPALREEIFERGEKGRNSGGTGFGLYFVDAMVQSYGGQIRLEESDAGGAAFVVELPRVE